MTLRIVRITVLRFARLAAPPLSALTSAARRVSLNQGRTVAAISTTITKPNSAEGDHRRVPGVVGLAKFSGQIRPEKSADAVAEIDGADGRGAIPRKITGGQREHRRGQHGHADALRREAYEHGPESGDDAW